MKSEKYVYVHSLISRRLLIIDASNVKITEKKIISLRLKYNPLFLHVFQIIYLIWPDESKTGSIYLELRYFTIKKHIRTYFRKLEQSK